MQRPPVVILGAAKDPRHGRPAAMRPRAALADEPGVLRCAQDDNGSGRAALGTAPNLMDAPPKESSSDVPRAS